MFDIAKHRQTSEERLCMPELTLRQFAGRTAPIAEERDHNSSDELTKAMGEIFAEHRAAVSTTIEKLKQRVTRLEGQVEDLKRTAARLPPIREYVIGPSRATDLVTHAGALWQARCDTLQAPPHGDWICLVRAGRDGQSPEVRGTFAIDETYKRLDVVAKNGAAFIARCDNPGMCPGRNWQMISRQGLVRYPKPMVRCDDR